MYDDAPQELVHDLIAEAVFGDHPLGRPVIGTAEVISSIPRESIARYHEEMYVPGNIVVAAAGNIDHDEIVELVDEDLGKRGAASAGKPNLRPALTEAPPPRLRFQRKDTEQYHVCLAAPGISRSDRRRFAASLLDAILGGSASSRLFQEIREKRGMAYAVYSFVSQYTDTGQIGVYLGTREDNLGDALAITAEQIADIAGGNLPAERARAGEGEPEGPHPALDGIDVDADEPARQVARDGLGADVDRPDRRRDRRRRGDARSRSSPRACSRPSASPPRASGRARSGSSRRSSASRRASPARRERPSERPLGQGRLGARSRARAGGPPARRLARRGRGDGRLHPSGRSARQRPRGRRRRRRERRRHDGLGHRRRRRTLPSRSSTRRTSRSGRC